MKIFSDGGELRLTHYDLLRAVDCYLKDYVLNSYGAEYLKDVYIDSLSLHPANKYAARITLKRIGPAEKKQVKAA